MSVEKKVTKIPATINPVTRMPSVSRNRRRVAGYARVSTDKDEQFTSYTAQIDYYTKFIQSHADWEFVDVYTDEGISGTNTKHRDGFNKMIDDALSGKIDLIVTKSISRFARNTVDSLVTIRKLKEANVECFFEKENIYTFDSKGEVLITIMSSLAQEESRSISENVTWGQRRRFSDGKVSMPYKQFLGYEKGPDGLPRVVPEQADLVRRIYDMFLSGKTTYAIAKVLTAEGIKTPAGKDKWQSSTVESILTNEKYKGDALLQKRFTVDFLEHKMKTNEGEVPQYYVTGSHEAIIWPEIWQQVQDEMERRKTLGNKYSGSSPFSCKIVCADCGDFYGSKVWNSTSKYKRTIWQCRHKFDGDSKCTTPHLDEEEIKSRFVDAFNRVFTQKNQILEDCRLMQSTLTDCSEIDREIAHLIDEAEVVTGLTEKLIRENSTKAMAQDEYNRRYDDYVERYNGIREKLDDLERKKNRRLAKANSIGGFIFELMEQDGILTEFDERLFTTVLDTITVHPDGRMIFLFQGGIETEN